MDEDTPFVPGETVFRSINWADRDTDDLSGLGEVWPAARPWAEGNEPWQAVPCTYLGAPDWWVHGVPAGTPPRPPRTPLLRMGLGLKARQRSFLTSWERLAVHLTGKLKLSDTALSHAFLAVTLMADLSQRYAAAVVYQLLAGLAAKAGLKDDAEALASLAVHFGLSGIDREDAQAVAGLGMHLAALLADKDTLAGKASVLAAFSQSVKLGETAVAAAALAVVLESKATLEELLALKQGDSGPEADKGKLSVSFSFAQFQTVTPSGGCGSLPTSLVARFSGFSGGCSSINGGAPTLTYSAVTSHWTGSFTPSGHAAINVTLACQGGAWNVMLTGSVSNGSGQTVAGTSGASPNLSGTMSLIAGGFCTGSGTCTITHT